MRVLLTDTLPWEKKRCFLRSGKLQIEEPGVSMSPMAAVSLEPDSVDVEVKIILIGATEQYYELQEMDPYFARRFKVKVDFAESFAANSTTYHASALIVAHACRRLGLPHFTASGVARLLEDSHREVDDQTRQSTIFSHTEAVVMESAVACQARAGQCFDAFDVEAALQARKLRHDYPDRRLQESITEGDRLIIPRAVTI